MQTMGSLPHSFFLFLLGLQVLLKHIPHPSLFLLMNFQVCMHNLCTKTHDVYSRNLFITVNWPILRSVFFVLVFSNFLFKAKLFLKFISQLFENYLTRRLKIYFSNLCKESIDLFNAFLKSNFLIQCRYQFFLYKIKFKSSLKLDGP